METAWDQDYRQTLKEGSLKVLRHRTHGNSSVMGSRLWSLCGSEGSILGMRRGLPGLPPFN